MLKLVKIKHRIDLACKIIENYKLYLFDGSGIHDCLCHHRNSITNIVIAKLNAVPIGCGIITRKRCMHESNIGIFVKPEFRKLGIGKAIYKKLEKPSRIYIDTYGTAYKFYSASSTGDKVELMSRFGFARKLN